MFVDIDPHTLNLDPNRIEAAITPRTTAILPVHVYGNPCDVEAIQTIADNYNLKVIDDAAHAFGEQDQGGSILRHGDLSVLSLHTTKVFNTCEGGAIICPDDKSKLHIDHLKNFGFVGETTVVASGINGKMNKMQSALGLLQLKHVDQALARRHAIDGQDREGLGATPGIRLLPRGSQVVDNHTYFPILVDDAYPLSRDQFYDKLKAEGISSLRFSYPPITEFPMYRGLPSVQATDLSTHPPLYSTNQLNP